MKSTGSDTGGVAYPGVAEAISWAEGVLAGRIPACVWVRLACQRHFNDLERVAADREWPYLFDPAKAERAIRFIELLPHTKGRWALSRQRLALSGWQKFFVAMVFGWVGRETGLRRFRRASLYVPRKNGKSTLAAAIGLYMLTADGEYAAEVYTGATKEKQAKEVYTPASIMARRLPPLRSKYGLSIRASKIEIPATGAVFEPVVGQPGDGSSPHCAINDEYHEHRSDALVDTMETGMAARSQPLMLDITTAGDDLSGPCYAHQQDIQAMLLGTVPNDHLFAMVFTIDQDDRWDDDEVLAKANPNLGVSVSQDWLTARREQARSIPRKQAVFKTKHLNMWVSAMDAYFNVEQWNDAYDKALRQDVLAGVPCFIGLDLASKKDLTVYVKLWRRDVDGEEHFYIAAPKFYLPEAAAAENERYRRWADEGALTLTPGNIIDYRRIAEDLRQDAARLTVEEMGFDPYGAHQFLHLLDDCSLTMTEVPQRVAHLSEPMKWLDAMISSGRLHHDGNPVMTWCISNVVAKRDANDNVFPRKNRDEQKIDGAVAAIIAMSRAMTNERTPAWDGSVRVI